MYALRQTAEYLIAVQYAGLLGGAGLFGLLYLGAFDHLWKGHARHAATPGRPSTSERLWLAYAAQAESYRPPGRPSKWSPSAAYEALKSARQRAAERSMRRRAAAMTARVAVRARRPAVVHGWQSAWGDDEWL